MFTVRPPSTCEIPSHLATVLRNVYFKKSIDFVWERICLQILAPKIVILGLQPHSVIGFHYAVDSTDVMYQVRRDPWGCGFEKSCKFRKGGGVRACTSYEWPIGTPLSRSKVVSYQIDIYFASLILKAFKLFVEILQE